MLFKWWRYSKATRHNYSSSGVINATDTKWLWLLFEAGSLYLNSVPVNGKKVSCETHLMRGALIKSQCRFPIGGSSLGSTTRSAFECNKQRAAMVIKPRALPWRIASTSFKQKSIGDEQRISWSQTTPDLSSEAGICSSDRRRLKIDDPCSPWPHVREKLLILWRYMLRVYVCACLSVCAYQGALNSGPGSCLFLFQVSTAFSLLFWTGPCSSTTFSGALISWEHPAP